MAEDIECLPYILSIYYRGRSYNLFSRCSNLSCSVVVECAGDIVVIIGIDPGLKGGICRASVTSDYWFTYAMPVAGGGIDLFELREILTVPLSNPPAKLVVIEKVHNMPKDGGSSSFKFGDGFGSLKGICVGLGLPFILVTPQQWKKTVLVGYDWKGNKGTSIVYVRQRYPHLSLKPTEGCRKDSHGLADAVCLAEYGVRMMGDGSVSD